MTTTKAERRTIPTSVLMHEADQARHESPIQSGFLTDLQVRRNVENTAWILTQPLIWQGDWETLYIKPGFKTDFASVPKVLRWLLDSEGKNAAAGVLHDVAWRESKTSPETRRIDPWHADGLFRRALRYAGVAPVPRNMLWVGVRIAASVSGRVGRRGPGLIMKIAKMLMWAVLAVLIIGVPLIAIFVGYLFYLVIGLLATPIALAYKAKRQADGDNYDPMRVLPRLAVPDAEITTIGGRLPQLLVIPSGESQKSVIERNETLRDLLRTYLSDIEANPAVHWQDLESARALQVATQDEG